MTQESEDPNVNFMHMCELGDERAIAEALKNKAQMIRMEDDKGATRASLTQSPNPRPGPIPLPQAQPKPSP